MRTCPLHLPRDQYERKDEPRDAEIIIASSATATGTVKLAFIKEHTRFEISSGVTDDFAADGGRSIPRPCPATCAHRGTAGARCRERDARRGIIAVVKATPTATCRAGALAFEAAAPRCWPARHRGGREPARRGVRARSWCSGAAVSDLSGSHAPAHANRVHPRSGGPGARRRERGVVSIASQDRHRSTVSAFAMTTSANPAVDSREPAPAVDAVYTHFARRRT